MIKFQMEMLFRLKMGETLPNVVKPPPDSLEQTNVVKPYPAYSRLIWIRFDGIGSVCVIWLRFDDIRCACVIRVRFDDIGLLE